MKKTLTAIALVTAGVVVVAGLAVAALHTIVELEEYQYHRYDD